MSDAFGRIDWLTRALTQIPMLISHIQIQTVPNLTAPLEGRVSGTKEKTTTPLRLDPLDDADKLWARTCALAAEHADRAQIVPPAALERQRRPRGSPGTYVQGLARSPSSRRASEDIAEISRWLVDRAWTLSIEQAYEESVNELVETVHDMQKRYPEAPRRPSARHRCPICGRHSVVAEYDKAGELRALRCEACGAERKYES